MSKKLSISIDMGAKNNGVYITKTNRNLFFYTYEFNLDKK